MQVCLSDDRFPPTVNLHLVITDCFGFIYLLQHIQNVIWHTCIFLQGVVWLKELLASGRYFQFHHHSLLVHNAKLVKFPQIFQARTAGRTWKTEGRTGGSFEAFHAEWNGKVLLPGRHTWRRGMGWNFLRQDTCIVCWFFDFNCLGKSHERASSTEGRDGVPVQDWQFWGECDFGMPLLTIPPPPHTQNNVKKSKKKKRKNLCLLSTI